MYYKYLRYILS